MDLWIRSQDKERLSKTTNIYVNGYNNRWAIYGYGTDSVHDFVLGTYKTKERALEVLDEIQKLLMPKLIIKNEGRDYVGLDGVVYRTNLATNTNTDIQQLSTYVYEMPIE